MSKSNTARDIINELDPTMVRCTICNEFFAFEKLWYTPTPGYLGGACPHCMERIHNSNGKIDVVKLIRRERGLIS